MIPEGFKGRAVRLKEIDIPLTARRIGTGEDELRAVIAVETAGGGFDKLGRPKMLFEPHVFYRELGATQKRVAAEAQGLAYPKWGAIRYPADSYPRLALAMKLDAQAAIRSASWGLGQIMGFNHKAAGYASAGEMVADFCDREVAHLEAMVSFIGSEGLDDDLRRHDWPGFARGYNGAGYATHGYHTRLAAAFKKWSAIPDALAPQYPNIGLGARGDAVRVAQTRLAALGFDPRGIDGWFGAGTDNAAVAFQASVGLTADGIIGPKTWAVLIPELETVK